MTFELTIPEPIVAATKFYKLGGKDYSSFHKSSSSTQEQGLTPQISIMTHTQTGAPLQKLA